MKKGKKVNPTGRSTGLVDIEKLKEFGITKDPNKGDIEEVDGENITGGKHRDADTTVVGQWPTGLKSDKY